MKINRDQLTKLIAEELRSTSTALLETLPPPPGELANVHQKVDEKDMEEPDAAEDPQGHEGEMVKRSLYHMSQQAQQLHDMVIPDDNLEPWVAEKISLAADYLEKAFKAITYDKGPGRGRY